jgi:hypothetical protein
MCKSPMAEPLVDAISVGGGFTAVRNDRVFTNGFEL